jgi:hypothetical protein
MAQAAKSYAAMAKFVDRTDVEIMSFRVEVVFAVGDALPENRQNAMAWSVREARSQTIRSRGAWAPRTLAMAVIVFQLRVVSRTPNSRSRVPR